MKKGEIDQKVKDIIIDVVGIEPEEINDDSNLTSDLGFDDLDTVEVIMKVETEFNISISDEEIDKIETFKYLVDLTQEESML